MDAQRLRPRLRVKRSFRSKCELKQGSIIPSNGNAPMTEQFDTSSLIRVVLIDDHPLLRQGVAMALQRSGQIHVIADAATAEAGLSAVREARPDVVVCDLTLPDKSGIEVVRILKAEQPELPVLILSMHEEELYAERCLRAGAKGYVTKSESPRQLVAAVLTVASGRLYASPELAQRLLTQAVSPVPVAAERDAGVRSLSDREFEVFELVGRGYTAKEIASQLGLSSKTVDVHRARIRTKLGLATTPDLTHFAVRWVQAQEGGAAL